MKTSFLVAAMGETKGAIVQCFARNATEAECAVSALFVDTYDEQPAVCCIDRDAVPGLFISSDDPGYIRFVLRNCGRIC